jgi:hypothetical protein
MAQLIHLARQTWKYHITHSLQQLGVANQTLFKQHFSGNISQAQGVLPFTEYGVENGQNDSRRSASSQGNCLPAAIPLPQIDSTARLTLITAISSGKVWIVLIRNSLCVQQLLHSHSALERHRRLMTVIIHLMPPAA